MSDLIYFIVFYDLYTHIRYAAPKTDNIIQVAGGKVPHTAQKCTEMDIEGGEFAWELFAHYKAVHLQGDIILEPLHSHIVPFQIVELLLFGRAQL